MESLRRELEAERPGVSVTQGDAIRFCIEKATAHLKEVSDDLPRGRAGGSRRDQKKPARPVLERLDALVAELQAERPGSIVSRADAIREAVLRGLDELETPRRK